MEESVSGPEQREPTGERPARASVPQVVGHLWAHPESVLSL